MPIFVKREIDMMLLLFIAGLVLMLLGADLMVRGSAGLAQRMGVSPLVIGATVVAFGTSAPEMAVGLDASLTGQTDLAVGNVVGSNIFNVLFILGLSSLLSPLAVAPSIIRREVPLMLGLSVLAFLLAADGSITRVEGGLLLLCFLVYTGWQVRVARREKPMQAVTPDLDENKANPLVLGMLVLVGLGMLALGSHWLVTASVAFARALGITELVVGLTILAAGTSLPEVAASTVAAIRGHRDLSIGNVVGSNFFNLTAVLGPVAIAAPASIPVHPQTLQFDFPVLLAAAFLCLPTFLSGRRISRAEGVTFLLAYITYVTVLVLKATNNPLLDRFEHLIPFALLPVFAVVLIVAVLEDARSFSLMLASIPTATGLTAEWNSAYRLLRRMAVALIGGTVVLIGIVMIVLPGPAFVVIPVGLAILGSEFLWAKRLLRRMKEQAGTGLKYIGINIQDPPKASQTKPEDSAPNRKPAGDST